MSYKLKNEIEESHKNRLSRYSKDDMLEKIYKGLPANQREPFVRYRELWQRVDKERIDLEFPLNLYIEPVSSCNLQCYFCVRSREAWKSKGGNIFSKAHLGLENFKKIIDEGARYSLPAIWVGASGEALLEKNLTKMMRYAHDKGIIDCCMITNGTMLTKPIIDELLDIPVTRITISIDAFSAETYKKLRGGNYQKLVDNIHYLLKKREQNKSILPVVRLTFVDIPENSEEKEDFINYWMQHADTVDVQKYFDFDCNFGSAPSDVPRDINCSFPWRSLMIMGNGDIAPCCSFYGMRDLVFGNICQNTLKKVWDSTKFVTFKNEMKDEIYQDPCKFCHDCKV